MIARQQLIYLYRSGRLVLSLWLLLILLGSSLLTSLLQQRALDREVQQATANERERWLHQGAKNPHLAAHWGLYAFRPRSLGSALDPGVTAFTGSSIWIEAHRENTPQFRDSDLGEDFASLGELSPRFVLTVLLPLILLLLTHDALAGERESGTLRTLLSLGVTPRQILWGKCWGTLAALLAVTAPTLILGGLAIAMTTGLETTRDNALALLGMLLAYSLYAAAFAALGLYLSLRCEHPRQSLAAGAACWIALCLVGPRLASSLVSAAYPVPTAANFYSRLDSALEKGLDGKSSPGIRRNQVQARLALGQALQGFALQAEEEHGFVVYDHVYGELEALYRRQNQLNEMAGLLCPSLAVSTLSMDLAGTDWVHSRDFEHQAEAYRRAMVGTMNAALQRHSDNAAFIADEQLWESLPPFHYQAAGSQNLLMPWVWLLLWVAWPTALIVTSKALS